MRAFLWQRWFAGAFDGNGGAHLAGAWRLPMDLMDLMDQMDNLGGAIVYPVGLHAAVWFGSGVNVPVGFAVPLSGLARA